MVLHWVMSLRKFNTISKHGIDMMLCGDGEAATRSVVIPFREQCLYAYCSSTIRSSLRWVTLHYTKQPSKDTRISLLYYWSTEHYLTRPPQWVFYLISHSLSHLCLMSFRTVILSLLTAFLPFVFLVILSVIYSLTSCFLLMLLSRVS